MKVIGSSNPYQVDTVAVRRIFSIHLQNDVIGDRLFVPEVAQALREIAQALDDGLIGNAAANAQKVPGEQISPCTVIAS